MKLKSQSRFNQVIFTLVNELVTDQTNKSNTFTTEITGVRVLFLLFFNPNSCVGVKPTVFNSWF